MAKSEGRKKTERKPEVEISEPEVERLRKYQVGEATMRQVGIVAGRKVIKITYVAVITK